MGGVWRITVGRPRVSSRIHDVMKAFGRRSTLILEDNFGIFFADTFVFVNNYLLYTVTPLGDKQMVYEAEYSFFL
jgi:hypothetical protein